MVEMLGQPILESKHRITASVLLVIVIVLSLLVTYFHAPILFHTRGIHTSLWHRLTSRIYQLSLDPSASNQSDASQESPEALLRIYEQQLARYRTAAFMPTYHNHHLRFRLDLKSIAVDLYGETESFRDSTQTLHIECLKKQANSTQFEHEFDLKLFFNVQQVEDEPLQFIVRPITNNESTLKISFVPPGVSMERVKEVILDVNRIYPVPTIFSFTYQWLDLKVKKTFDWPRWPLTRSCADQILNELIQQPSESRVSCSTTHVLHHSTSQRIFAEERSVMTEWLDLQHQASQSKNLAGSPSVLNRTRRGCPFESTLNPRVCSSNFQAWISLYQDWHANVSAGVTDPRLTIEQQRDLIIQGNIRFLLYEKCATGTADRMVHLVTTYLIAILTKRLFFFDANWSEFTEVMQSSLNYERDSIMPWLTQLNRLNRHLSPNHRNYLSSKQYWFGFDRLTQDRDYDRDCPERILHFQGRTGGIVRLLTSNTSIYRTFLTKELQMNAENMFGCLYHSLLVYRLSALIERTSTKSSFNLGHSSEELLQVLLSTNFYPIGVQVRLGDAAMQNILNASIEEKLIESSEHFLSCAADLIAGDRTSFRSARQVPIVYLLSDAVHLRQTALRRSQLPSSCLQTLDMKCQGERDPLFVISSPDPVLHITYSSQPALAFRLAMFDLFLFNLCEQHVITKNSGFGRIAVFASLKRRNISSLLIGKSVSCRLPGQSVSLAQSGYHWSGI